MLVLQESVLCSAIFWVSYIFVGVNQNLSKTVQYPVNTHLYPTWDSVI